MKKNVFVQIVSHTVLVVLISMTLLNDGCKSSKADFTGSWILNADKSHMEQPPQGMGQPPQGQPQSDDSIASPTQRMGRLPEDRGLRMDEFAGSNFTVIQEGNQLKIERTSSGREGQEVTIATSFKIDGKEYVNTMGRGESKSIANWSDDGQTLTIVTTRIMGRDERAKEMKTTEVWNLTDPTTLSIVSTMNTANVDYKTYMVYDKK